MRRPNGRPNHAPTPEQRQLCELAAVIGTTHHDIAQLLGITTKTLLKHYRKELDLGKTRANVKVGGALYNAAVKGNTSAQIFWMKAQAGWREVNRVEHANADGKPLKHAVVQAVATDEDAMQTYLRMLSGEE
jgi:predicted transcriptional regulator